MGHRSEDGAMARGALFQEVEQRHRHELQVLGNLNNAADALTLLYPQPKVHTKIESLQVICIPCS